jgi:hypothetical protein
MRGGISSHKHILEHLVRRPTFIRDHVCIVLLINIDLALEKVIRQRIGLSRGALRLIGCDVVHQGVTRLDRVPVFLLIPQDLLLQGTLGRVCVLEHMVNLVS